MTAESSHIVIVGGGLAGWKSAEELRRAGFDGRLTMLSEEAHRPYDRPPLSKRMLKVDVDPKPFPLWHEESNEESLRLELLSGARAVGLEPGAVRIETIGPDGSVEPGTVAYDALVIATGVRARELPALAGHPRVHLLRTFDDVLRLRAALETSSSLLVVGAGFIGAEVATAAHDRGLAVTVIEALQVPYARNLGELMGGISGRLAARYGVTLKTGTGVEAVLDSTDSVKVQLADASTLEADIAVVGIGTVVNAEWLASLADWSRGVPCDEHGRVLGAPDGYGALYALGDVAAWHDDAHGDHTRFEHWTTAVEQAPILAAALLGDLGGTQSAQPEPMVPYFWSDQYGRKIQLMGRPGLADSVEILHGEEPADLSAPGPRKLVAGYFDGDELVAVATISAPVLLGKYRPLLVERATREQVLAHAATL